jgi:type IV pilus assembly protein PilC
MPQYSYQAVGGDGKTAKGTLAADSLSGAAAVLRRRGLVITGLKEQERPASAEAPPAASWDLNRLLIRISRVKQSDVVVLLWQMAALLASGVTITSALSVLEAQCRNRRLKFILSSVRRDVEAGQSLTDAMARFPKTFPPMVTSALKTGETTGLLDTTMERVAAYWEEKLALLGRIIASSIYPAIVLLMSLGVVYFMVGHVIPSIAPLMAVMGGEMPWATEVLVYIADNLSANLNKLGIGLAGLMIVMAGVYRLPASRYFIDRHKTRLPLLGSIFQYAIVVHFARTLSLLINSGVSVLEALKATRETTGNKAVKRVIDRMIDRVLHGESLSEPLLRAGNYFPPMVGSMVKVGEETGQVDASLTMVAGIYAKLLDGRINKMISLMEPLLLVVLGGVVAFIVAAIVSGILASYGGMAAG